MSAPPHAPRRRPPTGWRRWAPVVAVFAALSTAAGCATVVHGRGSLQVAPDANLRVHGYSGSAFDREAKNAIADVEAYWRKAYPSVSSGSPLPAIKGGLWSVDGDTVVRTHKVPPAVANEGCLKQRPTFIVDNAAYCRVDDSIVWDRSPDHLLPALARTYGPVLAALAFAHEFGHAIQSRTGAVRKASSTIDLESQADCAAGAFIGSALKGGAPHFAVTRTALDRALDGYLLIRDTTPQSPSEVSHGDGFDRLNALQQGITQGPAHCYSPSYFKDQTFTERGYVSDSDLVAGGNLPLREVLRRNFLTKDLNRFWRATATGLGKTWKPVSLHIGRPPCASGGTALAYCRSDNSVYIESAYARQAYYSVAALSLSPRTGAVQVHQHQPGDFALGTMLTMAWGFAGRSQLQNAADSGTTALLTAVCDAGAYAANVNVPETSKKHPFVLSPPDMDEATSAVLDLVPQAQAFGARGTDGLQRIERFVHGYDKGIASC